MTTSALHARVPFANRAPSRSAVTVRRATGAFFVAMAGVHVGIVAADPQTYAPFADQALFAFVRTGWSEVFMATPAFWALSLALAEALVGAGLLTGGRAARVAWVAAIGFHLLLGLFGIGIWLWCLPALAFLVAAARADWPGTTARAGRGRR